MKTKGKYKKIKQSAEMPSFEHIIIFTLAAIVVGYLVVPFLTGQAAPTVTVLGKVNIEAIEGTITYTRDGEFRSREANGSFMRFKTSDGTLSLNDGERYMETREFIYDVSNGRTYVKLADARYREFTMPTVGFNYSKADGTKAAVQMTMRLNTGSFLYVPAGGVASKEIETKGYIRMSTVEFASRLYVDKTYNLYSGRSLVYLKNKKGALGYLAQQNDGKYAETKGDYMVYVTPGGNGVQLVISGFPTVAS